MHCRATLAVRRSCAVAVIRWLLLPATIVAALTLDQANAAGVEPSSSAPPSTEMHPVSPSGEVVVQTPEPRFVAPTRRDKIGRIWAPVFLNGHGPFRLVLDTGATDSAITASVASALGLVPDSSHAVLVRGVTGSAIV